MRKVAENGHAVVVVAEGAGEELMEELNTEADKSGNKKLQPIAEFMKEKINDYFKQHNKEITLKYIDPSYMIRSVPANAMDALYCMLLAQNAVHGAMAGFTAFTVGLINNRYAYIPIRRICQNSPRVLNPDGRSWERLRAVTGQPEQVPSKVFIDSKSSCDDNM